MKVTLTHIGAVSLGRLLAVWTFIFGLIVLLLWALVSVLITLIGLAAGTNLVPTLIALAISLGMGIVGLIIFAIVMFFVGFITALVYDIILKVGGGIDFDLKERT